MRPTNEHERRDLKAICNRALRQVGASNFVNDTRVSEGHLSRYGGLADVDYMPIDVVADLERVVGYPLVSEHLAGLSGFALVPVSGSARTPDMEDVARLATTKGALVSAFIKALLDSRFDAHEVRELLPVLDDAIAQMQDLRRGLQGVGK
ncbi:hypothetical protein NBH19_08975 [Rhizobium sp. S95]|uniref:Uncharacterized protein n=1 Tax=Ciceribacter sichuanensis TaxID=2949647 RepID=A0AAJ1BWM7_9HYPH|nr:MULTISPECIES: hypothetical protein [unclassified Ciceribacter]MCM2396210.1 hypothetical protein [Ciceribacter sp. S95]MCO5957639.1 hypothetical protein [Ciceribacter sp. S101]